MPAQSGLVALSAREKKFVAAYDGNGTKACRAAGYAGDSATLGVQACRLLRKASVREAIAARDEGALERLTLSVAEVQDQWSRIAADTELPLEQRLAAMRDLVKSQGGFVHRHEVAIGKSLEEFLRETLTEPKK